MIFQILTLDLLITIVSIFLFIIVVFTASMILTYLIMNAAIWLKQEMKTRRNNKRRRK